jgi:cellulose synthase/poly-beta-1,6-N-acetylglucosamine synthase-like glycosyltransferase
VDLTRVSVVVTAHDAASTVADCLRSLGRQRGLPGGAPEIVLVDDRSTDGTAEAARAAGVSGLRVLRIERFDDPRLTARQVALDRGFQAARGAWVFLTDADGIAEPGWLGASLARLQRERGDAIAGPVSFRPAGAVLADLQSVDAVVYLAWVRGLQRLGGAPGVLFGSFGVRRAAYDSIGGFAALGPALTEDLAFARALHRRGFRVLHEARPRVSVNACAGWADLVARAQRTSAGGASALSLSLGAWALSLPALAAAAAIAPALVPALALRYGVGAAGLAVALARAGRWRLLPYALLYEPAALAAGAGVLARLARGRAIEWGGIRYARTGRARPA